MQLRSYREIPCIFYPIFSNRNIFRTIVQYHPQDIDLDNNPPILFRFPQFYLYLCVCTWFYTVLLHVQFHVSIITGQGRLNSVDTEQVPSSIRSLILLFYNRIHFSPAVSPLPA